ncbi:hypothetical protein DVH05_026863 [Phytophthora capsici]|nr:hypothetical protein DVH05_026863 [Phytophthora capsici]
MAPRNASKLPRHQQKAASATQVPLAPCGSEKPCTPICRPRTRASYESQEPRVAELSTAGIEEHDSDQQVSLEAPTHSNGYGSEGPGAGSESEDTPSESDDASKSTDSAPWESSPGPASTKRKRTDSNDACGDSSREGNIVRKKRDGSSKIYVNGFEYTRATRSQVKVTYRCSFYRIPQVLCNHGFDATARKMYIHDRNP